MNNKLLALALAAGMATMVSGPVLAQSQGHQSDHRGHHGDHRGHHGTQAGQTDVSPGHGEASDARTDMPDMADCPMMQGGNYGGMMSIGPMMQGMMQRGMMPMHQRHAHGHAGTASADMDMSASSIAFRAVNEAMHHGMDIEMTGDADVDFVRGMIAHHVGAVDMARIVQIFGSDPEIAALAEEIIEAQEAEIAMMRDWLDRNAVKADWNFPGSADLKIPSFGVG